MGVVANIGIDQWPKQGSFLGKRVKVCFNYDARHVVMGTIVREDDETPWMTIISLDTGKVVLATECQFSLEEWEPKR